MEEHMEENQSLTRSSKEGYTDTRCRDGKRNCLRRWKNFKYELYLIGSVCLLFYFPHVIGRFATLFHEPLLSTSTNDSSAIQDGVVLVTGATGRTGSLLYHSLKDRGVKVRAFVRNVDKARDVLNCTKCDETEGIYVGDLMNYQDLQHTMDDGLVTTLAIAAGAGATSSKEIQRLIEFDSVVNSVRAMGIAHKQNGNKKMNLRVVLCSSMGTNQTPQPEWGGDILFWKLNAEAFLSTSGISSAVIIKPCGLSQDMVGNNSTLMVGHNGTFIDPEDDGSHYMISREDVASVMAEAVVMSSYDNVDEDSCGPMTCRRRDTNLRFDLCSRPGPVTTDLKGLIEKSRWEWD